MEQDQKYEHALSAPLVILQELDRAPDMAKHNLLALVVYSILHAMDGCEKEKDRPNVRFSVN